MYQQMKYFVAVVDEHNFTRAAANCNISQSAISQQIKELEAAVGVPLLKRQGRSFVVTPAGHYFYQHAQKILAQVADLLIGTRQVANQEAEAYVLRLGYLATFGTQEFLKAVADFSQEFPKVKVNVTSGTHEHLFELLRNGQIDLNFSDQRRALSAEYQNEFLTATTFQAVVPQGQFTGQDHLTTSELADLPCILAVSEQQAAAEEEYCQNVLGVQSPFRLAATLDEAQMMVAANQGFTIVNSRTANQVNPDVVQVIPLYNGAAPLHQKYYAYWKQDNSGYYIESFAKKLKEQFD